MAASKPKRNGVHFAFYFTNFDDKAEPLLCRDQDQRAIRDIIGHLQGKRHKDTNEIIPSIPTEVFNASTAGFRKQLESIRKNVKAKSDYLFVYILSHGDHKANILTRDGKEPLIDILHLFKDENCPRFAGKPKIFLIQACRGHILQPQVQMELTRQLSDQLPQRQRASSVEAYDEIRTRPRTRNKSECEDGTDLNDELNRVCNHIGDNFFIGYATPPGRLAFYTKEEGSQFTKHLREVIREYGDDEGIMQLLTRVNHRMAKDSTNEQVCYFVSRLVDNFYLSSSH